MLPKRTVTSLVAAITGNVAAQEMLQQHNDRQFGSPGIEAGGRIVLGTATTVDVVVTDANGKVLYNDTVVADVDINPVAHAVQGPLMVTTTNISNAAHTLSVYWGIKK